MKNPYRVIFFSVILFCIQPLWLNAHDHSEGETQHDEHAEEQGFHDDHEVDAVGKKGGKLLTKDDLSVEITMFETGVPPEMRIYLYQNGKAIAPDAAKVKVVLDRLGGKQDTIQFTPESDYLVSSATIKEPHSYDVTVSADFKGKNYQWHYDNHEGRAEISDRFIQKAGIKTEKVRARTIIQTEPLFGIIAPVQDSIYQAFAPYPSLVRKVHVELGDKVTKGQKLVSLTNTETLQSYTVDSQVAGIVTERWAVSGEKVIDQPLLQVTDLSTVWVELSAFPEAVEKLKPGQTVTVNDLHGHEKASGKLIYIAPVMTGGHIARARAVINNAEGYWRAGMHIKAQVEVGKKQAALSVKRSALQTFRDTPVVFAKFGNTFEVRMVDVVDASGTSEYVEVLDGIRSGTAYVTENSFVLKADILKGGASHAH